MTMPTPSHGSRPWGWLLATVAAALAAAALALAIVALVGVAAHEHADDPPWADGAGPGSGHDRDWTVPEPAPVGEATDPSPASAGPNTAPLPIAEYLAACAAQERERAWPATWGAAGEDVRDILNAAWATTPPPELAAFHARRLQGMAMVLAFIEAQEYAGPLTEASAAALAIPAMAAADLVTRAAAALDADLQGQLVAAGCWTPSER